MTESGKETMCDKIVKRIRLSAGIFAVCILCGCTRREQLVLEDQRGAQSAQVTEGPDRGGLSDDDAADGSVPARQSQDAVDDSGQAASVRPGAGALAQTAVEDAGAEKGQTIQSGEALTICVHVCGAVKAPGVYELAAGSRVFEAVREAGGFTEEADESYVNQAQRLTDGAKLVIPTVEQVKEAAGDGAGSAVGIGVDQESGAEQADGFGVSVGSGSGDDAESASDGKININTASEAQLCEIPGIGAARAAAIVAYREQSGGFTSTEDIMNVSGIKEGTYAKIKDRIKVD